MFNVPFSLRTDRAVLLEMFTTSPTTLSVELTVFFVSMQSYLQDELFSYITMAKLSNSIQNSTILTFISDTSEHSTLCMPATVARRNRLVCFLHSIGIYDIEAVSTVYVQYIFGGANHLFVVI